MVGIRRVDRVTTCIRNEIIIDGKVLCPQEKSLGIVIRFIDYYICYQRC